MQFTSDYICYPNVSSSFNNALMFHTTPLSPLATNQPPILEADYDFTINDTDAVLGEQVQQVSPPSIDLHSGSYTYTSDLLSLEARWPLRLLMLPPQCGVITTPLIINNWNQALRNHPDKQFVDYIVNGLVQGFHIGVDPIHRCTLCKDNMRSAYEHPQPVEDYLATELAAGRIAGPFDPHELQEVIVSRFGVIPKTNQAGKWRLILDLSSPKDSSVNNGIPSELCSLCYITTDDAVEKVMELGIGCLLAKVDVEHAYRNIPIHPEDRSLIAMK